MCMTKNELINDVALRILQGLLGYGCAIELANRNIEAYNKKLLDLREYYISSVEKSIKDIRVNGDRKDRLSR